MATANGGPTCENCKCPGYCRADCWSKGGGKEGQGPFQKKQEKKKQEAARKLEKSETMKQIIEDLPNVTYLTNSTLAFGKTDWLLDSGSSSHIATI